VRPTLLGERAKQVGYLTAFTVNAAFFLGSRNELIYSAYWLYDLLLGERKGVALSTDKHPPAPERPAPQLTQTPRADPLFAGFTLLAPFYLLSCLSFCSDAHMRLLYNTKVSPLSPHVVQHASCIIIIRTESTIPVNVG
jgi:hypothetical protein